MSEILLPDNAPECYRDREVLWNEVQRIEKRTDAQFAREVEVALPAELSQKQQIACVRAYVKENFVDAGMIADWALHDKNDGNPHAHILLTVRGFDERKKWAPKQKTVFANSRDETGRPIYNPDLPSYDSKNREATKQYRIPALDKNGNQKTRTRKGKGTEFLWEKVSIPVNDWNDRKHAEQWRASWAVHCNRYLSEKDRIDHRSYERQGLDREATIHEGVTARKMEAVGNVSDRCQTNREIRERNFIQEQIKQMVGELTQLITEKGRMLLGRFKAVRRNIGNDKPAGRDRGNHGSTDVGKREPEERGCSVLKTASRERGFDTGEKSPEPTADRIDDFMRKAEQTDRDIKTTERKIAGTDQTIGGLRNEIQRRRRSVNERIRELRKRREAFGNHDGDAGRNRAENERPGRERPEAIEQGTDQLRTTGDDIRAFLAGLDAKERAGGEKPEDYIFEQTDKQQRKTDEGAQREMRESDERDKAFRRRGR